MRALVVLLGLAGAACAPTQYHATGEAGRQCYWGCRTAVADCRRACAAYGAESEQRACVANCDEQSDGCIARCPEMERVR